jgi:hypothetical protein
LIRRGRAVSFPTSKREYPRAHKYLGGPINP